MEDGNQPVCDWDSDDESHLENRNISELISKLRYEFRQAKFDSVEETLVLRETKLKRECERLKLQLEFERLERIKIEKEFRDYRPEVSELERLRESQTIMKEEVKMAEERAEMAEEKFDKLLGRFKDRLGDKLELIELKREMGELKSTNGVIEADNQKWEKKLGVLAARVAELERDTAFVLRNPDANCVISEQENRGTGKLAHVETILIEDSDDECAPGDFSRKQSSEKLAEHGGTTGGERCSNVLKRERSSPTRIDVDENSRDVSVLCSKMSKHQERILEANGSLRNTSANANGTPAANDAENLNGSSGQDQSAIKRSAGTKRSFENFLEARRNLIDGAGMEDSSSSSSSSFPF
ncbi:hypothetical protein UlMin_002103 [Ulmus minor]